MLAARTLRALAYPSGVDSSSAANRGFLRSSVTPGYSWRTAPRFSLYLSSPAVIKCEVTLAVVTMQHHPADRKT